MCLLCSLMLPDLCVTESNIREFKGLEIKLVFDMKELHSDFGERKLIRVLILKILCGQISLI